jgi:D-sedoheptulose 7-phosphate isomerase
MHPTLQTLLSRYPDLHDCIDNIENAYHLLKETSATGKKLLVCGNGGSASDSEHIVGELMKGFQLKRPISHEIREKLVQTNPQIGTYLADNLQGALPAIALSSHSALNTAISNDVAGDMIFAQQVYGYGQVGDSLLCMSTSGNSTNILNALHVGGALDLHTIGLTGRSGGKMANLCDVVICVPSDDTATIQERHLPIYHALCIMLEQEFFDA